MISDGGQRRASPCKTLASVWRPFGHPTTQGLSRHHAERLVDRAQHAVELGAAAYDQPGGRDHAVGALAARQLWIFLDAVERNFAGAAEHRKHSAVAEKVDGVIAPLAGSDLASIE